MLATKAIDWNRMTNYLCAISSGLSDNYTLAMDNGVWGVQSAYAQRIDAVKPGDDPSAG